MLAFAVYRFLKSANSSFCLRNERAAKSRQAYEARVSSIKYRIKVRVSERAEKVATSQPVDRVLFKGGKLMPTSAALGDDIICQRVFKHYDSIRLSGLGLYASSCETHPLRIAASFFVLDVAWPMHPLGRGSMPPQTY